MITELATYHGKLLNTQFGVPESYDSYAASGVLIERFLIALS